MKRLAVALIVLVVTTSVAPVAMGQSSGQAYAGTHVSFDTSERAVTDYAVHEETILDSVKVQSQSNVENDVGVGVGASLSAVTQVEGAALGLEAQSETEARVAADNGATMTAHDNGRGILVVASGNESNYVVANVSDGANATAESDSQVSVTTENGTQSTFIVVGDGNVTVNDDGDVTANLGEGGRLVLRSYPEGKDDADDEHEDLIAEGTAKAETYVMAENGSDDSNGTDDGTTDGDDGSDDGDNQVVVDTVSYDDNTTASGNQTAEGAVELTVNRTTHEGTVVITSVSDQALDASDDLQVNVDGEAATEAATYTQLESAIGSDQSRYLVESGGSADASADVLVAVNHFSERTISMQSGGADQATTTDESADDETTADGETTDDGSADGTEAGDETTDENDNDGGVPGFTSVTAVVALIAAALFARLR